MEGLPETLGHLKDSIKSYNPKNWHQRQESERFRSFSYEDIVARDKANPDIFWPRDDSLEDSDNLPAPDVLAAETVENLEAALEQFSEIYAEGVASEYESTRENAFFSSTL